MELDSIYVVDCSACKGKGIIYFGNKKDSAIEACECTFNEMELM